MFVGIRLKQRTTLISVIGMFRLKTEITLKVSNINLNVSRVVNKQWKTDCFDTDRQLWETKENRHIDLSDVDVKRNRLQGQS